MNYQDQEFLSESLPPELMSKVNIVSIQTGEGASQVITAALTMGLEILEEVTTHQYAYLKIDEQGQAYSLSGAPIKI